MLSDRCAALGYSAYQRPDGKWKVEGQAPMTVAEASAWATMREVEKASDAKPKRGAVDPVMWVERDSAGRYHVFWADCDVKAIAKILPAVIETAIAEIEP